MTAALVRYVWSDAARSQRWIAPLFLFVAACAIFNSDAGPLLTTYADTIACLLPVAIWLTWIVSNSEDPIQASITAVTVGSTTRLRLTKLLTAFAASAVLALFATLLPLALANHTDRATLAHVGAGGFGHLLVAAAGVAIGSLLMQSVIRRAGWAFLVASVAVLLEIVIPQSPPLRQLLVAFDNDHPAHLASALALATASTVVLGVVLITIALRVARARD